MRICFEDNVRTNDRVLIFDCTPISPQLTVEDILNRFVLVVKVHKICLLIELMNS